MGKARASWRKYTRKATVPGAKGKSSKFYPQAPTYKALSKAQTARTDETRHSKYAAALTVVLALFTVYELVGATFMQPHLKLCMVVALQPRMGHRDDCQTQATAAGPNGAGICPHPLIHWGCMGAGFVPAPCSHISEHPPVQTSRRSSAPRRPPHGGELRAKWAGTRLRGGGGANKITLIDGGV
jgi:hypothetical protein